MQSQAFGDDGLGQFHINNWFKCFKYGRTSVHNDFHSGWSSTHVTPENDAAVHTVIF